MSNRRMFSNRIANSAKFLQMPAETQLLYFHMVQRADDDGVVEAYPLLKLLGLAPDNFKLLVVKGYIKPLNEDQVIVIMDWLEHNHIRADRKVDSIYKNLLTQKIPDLQLIEPKPRSDVEDNSKRVGGQSTDGLGKVRLGKEEVEKTTSLSVQGIRTVKTDDLGGVVEGSEKTKKVGKNNVALKIRLKFGELGEKKLGTKPIVTDAKSYQICLFALKHLQENQVYDLFDEWFDLPKPDEELISLTRALSAHQIEQYKLRNNL